MRFIQTIRLDRILSFGPNDEAFALEPLNVLIGPNASGKSNFDRGVVASPCCSKRSSSADTEGGGVREWMWKGEYQSPEAKIDVRFVSFLRL